MSSNNNFTSFSMNQPILGTKDFLESNSLVIRFSFLIMVIIAFVILLKVGIRVLTFFLAPSNQSTNLINGMVDATQSIVFTQAYFSRIENQNKRRIPYIISKIEFNIK